MAESSPPIDDAPDAACECYNVTIDVSLGHEHDGVVLLPSTDLRVKATRRGGATYRERRPIIVSRSRRESVGPSATIEQPLSDTVLEGFRKGDETAFDAVFRFYYPRLCQFVCSTFGFSTEDAEDVVQNAFIKIWRSLDRLPADVTIAACLFQVARTQALEVLGTSERRARLRGARAVPFPQTSPEQPDDAAHNNLLLDQIRRAIASFPQRCRDAFWLRRVGGLTYAEIGRALGMEPRTAETHVRDGHRRLLEKLGDRAR